MKHSPDSPRCGCSCCAAAARLDHSGELIPDPGRRQFLYRVGALTAGGLALPAGMVSAAAAGGEAAVQGPRPGAPLRVQPVFTYSVPQRREATSWREWGGIQTEADASAEQERIRGELAKLRKQAGFGLEFLPLVAVRNREQAANLAAGSHDVLLMYAAGGSGQVLEALTRKDRWNLMFLRHDPGPVYLWYEIVHPRFLRKTVDEYGQPGMDVHDVVVDHPDDLLWRLRGLYGLKQTLGKRMVAVGGPSGWAAGGRKAPEIARTVWRMDLQDYPYADLGRRLKAARADAALVRRSAEQARRYLGGARTTLETSRAFVDNAFVLLEVFKDILREAGTDAITINSCMGTIMPMSETTACLPLSLLNDEGFLAFCESDFVVIPSGVLLHYIAGTPVFLNDPTYPHRDVVTLAHCTAPRRMDGRRAERARIMTHFESDYGAAPKVEMRLGQRVTNLVPDFNCKQWVGFEGTIVANPFLDICRSQIDVRVHGNTTALLEEMKGFHWMTCYGSYLRETGYALRKIGVDLRNVSSEPRPA
ncbi:MAG TPA: sugar isomerase [Verrucomicrobiota bacterium]|nr:sugar isomerase [Verrucomicrobiota bacterium]HNU50522.1 sugar isomerase [Verrucomicrobiota bacterium]